MIYLIIFLFLMCYLCSYKRKVISLVVVIFIFTFVFLYEIFGAFFFSLNPVLFFNFWLFFLGVLYFIFWFVSFYWLSRLGVLGVFFHSLLMTLVSVFKIILPLHPVILLYPKFHAYLPRTEYVFLNLFLLFFCIGMLFCKSKKYLMAMLSVFLVFIILGTNNPTKINSKNNIRVAIIQIGLYFDKGGNTSDFLSDLLNFLNENKKVDAIIFSENNLYSYKREYNKELTELLLNNIFDSRTHEKYHLFLSFSGFKDINNIVTYYHFNNNIQLNQKKALIPFFEKDGILNKKESMESDYFNIDEKINNKNIYIKGNFISTFICFDSLFPDLMKKKSDIMIIQSNYKLLDRGYGHNKLKIYATYLSKFINGVNNDIVINVQNHGGSVILFNDWSIDHHNFKKSLSNPFFIIDTQQQFNAG